MAIKIGTIQEPLWLQIKEQIKTLGIIFEVNLKKQQTPIGTTQLPRFGKWSGSTQPEISTYCKKLFCATLSI
jgi:hypothetical protein